MNVVFLQGMRVRSGTNFVSKFVSYHPDVTLLPPDKTRGEFRLPTSMPSWMEAFDRTKSICFGMAGKFQFDDYVKYLGESWLRYIRDLHVDASKCIFLKDPSVKHLDLLPALFPQAKLVVLTRDGRDNVASCIRAARAVRRTTSPQDRMRKAINHWTLRDVVGFSRAWAEAARDIEEFEASTKHANTPYLRMRFEDLFRDPINTGRELFTFMGLSCTDEILERAAAAPVVGSSFYSTRHRENSQKPNWTPTEKTSAFQPIGRWHDWGPVRRAIVKRFAGQELVSLGYADDWSW